MKILIAHRNPHLNDWILDVARRAHHEAVSCSSQEVLLDDLASTQRFDFLVIQEGPEMIDGIKMIERLQRDERNNGLQIILLAESSDGIIKAAELDVACMTMTRFSSDRLMEIIHDLSPDT